MAQAQGRMSATSRVLTLLALLAGLLAMHGLAGGAHAAHAAAAPVAHTAADMSVADMAMTGIPTLAGVTESPVSGVVAAPAKHGGAVMVAMVLCLVVLVSIAATLLAPPWRSHSLRRTAPPSLPRLRTRSAPRGPPRDLLSQLCVLRT